MAEDRLGQFVGFVLLFEWLDTHPGSEGELQIATARTGAQPTMLTVEHEEAAAVRYARLKAHAPKRPHGFSIRWLFALLGWHRLKADIRRH